MIHYVTVATGNTDRAQAIIQSFAHFHTLLVNLGENRDYPGHGTKVVLLREFLRDANDADLVCYVDAFDVLLIRDPSGLPALFQSLRKEILFYAEAYFTYKRNKIKKWFVKRKLPSRQHRELIYPFLNAGCFVGYARPMREFLNALPIHAATPCDQTPMVDFWIKHPDKIALDYQQQIFSGTGGREGFEESDFEFKHSGVKNRLTGSEPYFAHFPGKNWVGMNRFLGEWGKVAYRSSIDDRDTARFARAQLANFRSSKISPNAKKAYP